LVALKLKSFQTKVLINESLGAYQIKTAETEAELLEVLSLRAEVFLRKKLMEVVNPSDSILINTTFLVII
tara:strand:- start:31036 stop:31245 length:210 start_codon:yes stop_codon:yes gene_type:complete